MDGLEEMEMEMELGRGTKTPSRVEEASRMSFCSWFDKGGC